LLWYQDVKNDSDRQIKVLSDLMSAGSAEVENLRQALNEVNIINSGLREEIEKERLTKS